LSEFINVWVSETKWDELGPHGAIGCASALIYTNPRLILEAFRLLQEKRWDELGEACDFLRRLKTGLAPFREKGFQDMALDHLQGSASGFLKMHPRSRGPYTSCSPDDVAQLRSWMEQNVPEMLVF
jgi:hypothetical protein